MSLRTPLAALAAAVLAAGVAAVPASAAKAPTKQQAAAITAAVKRSTQVVKPSWYTVDRIKISSLSPSWAVAWQTPTKAGENRFQPAYLILVQPQGLKTWTVVSLGTSMVGCGVAPDSVVKDLTGQPCPPGEGIKSS